MTTIAKRSKQLDALLRKLSRTISSVGQRCTPAAARDAAFDKPKGVEQFESSIATTTKCFCGRDMLLRCLIESFLCWNTRGDEALTVMRRFDETLVDANELRVMMPGEVADLLGSAFDDVFAIERIERLLGTLNEIYKREHKVSLAQFAGKPPKAALSYVSGLVMPLRYVVDRFGMLECQGLRVPIDDFSLRLLIDAQVMEPEATPEEASDFVSKHLKDSNLHSAFAHLEAAPISEDWKLPSEPIQPTADDEAHEVSPAAKQEEQVSPVSKKAGTTAKAAAEAKHKKVTKPAKKAATSASKTSKPARKSTTKARRPGKG